jgi:putative ABC transport system substrate-binding protein
MRRREFLTLLGGAAATWPVAASAQQERVPIRKVRPISRRSYKALQELGWIDGCNVRIDYRWTGDDANSRVRDL